MLPKKKCCTSKPRCKRCPIRLMADGKLPPGYTVRKRKLVKVKGTPAHTPVADVPAYYAAARKGKKKKSKRNKAKARLAA